ncbi:MAG: nitrogen regulation protein NR(II) [Zoogloeaceae bacterium]|jgi:two-component system nitrogen regulation sensor histidine kinase GlnL|nr:nitrogen regulation protein NR(II) [Zoogloeaceae bacterium]
MTASALSANAPSRFSAFDLLSHSILLTDADLVVRHANSAAENLFARARRALIGQPLMQLLSGNTPDPTLQKALTSALENGWSYSAQDLKIRRMERDLLHADCNISTVSLKEAPDIRLLLELEPIDQRLKASREERLIEQQEASRELIRNLAHEIKNPLGGIRGAAQLLQRELPDPALAEYTEVIIAEADRLQDLMQRLLTPHRTPLRPARLNVHEVLERISRLLQLEHPDTLIIERDYDASLPEISADREQLIQVFLNIARNAAQALQGQGKLTLRTRAARQIQIARERFRLVIDVSLIDNGPGIPEDFREKMFYPLVSGRPNGSGLGLTIAQNFVHQHKGIIECESRPGRTEFKVRLPVEG